MKNIEQAILDKILYIGNEIPEELVNDKREKFILLGTPQELINVDTDYDVDHLFPDLQEDLDKITVQPFNKKYVERQNKQSMARRLPRADERDA